MIIAGPQHRKYRSQRPPWVSSIILALTDFNRLCLTRWASKTHRPLWAKTDSKPVESLTSDWLIKAVVAPASSHLASSRSSKSRFLVSLKQACSSHKASSRHLEVASHLEASITFNSSSQQVCSSHSSRPSLEASNPKPRRCLCLIQVSNRNHSSQRVRFLVRQLSSPSRCFK